ncbi:hypothetical protein V2J09_023963 [Rumex salicifolius]
MSAVISQLTCSTSLRRHNHLQVDRRSTFLRQKFPAAVILERPNAEACRLGNKLNLYHSVYLTRSKTNETAETYPATEEPVDEKIGINGPVEPVLIEKKQGAMIHDFCFGIPFGGFVLAAGLIGFIFSRNTATLTTNVLFGGSLLALSSTSLKVWRSGKSCIPFILGQAALSAVLCWKNFKTYSVTKQLLPSGVYAFLSAAMLCFYSYVVIAGGNPPPKKLKSSASYAS